MSYFWIFLGGGLGSIARAASFTFVARYWGATFPWGTLLVNILGSFVIGAFATLTETEGRWLVSPSTRQFVMAGLCGGYTTFSAFSLQTLELARNDQWFRAGANAVLSLALCLAAVWLGHLLAASFNSAKGL